MRVIFLRIYIYYYYFKCTFLSPCVKGNLNFYVLYIYILMNNKDLFDLIRVVITAVTSMAPYLTDKGEHTAFYKISNKIIH